MEGSNFSVSMALIACLEVPTKTYCPFVSAIPLILLLEKNVKISRNSRGIFFYLISSFFASG